MKKISTAAVAALMAGTSLAMPMTALAANNPTITYGSAVSDDKGEATADTEVVYSTLNGPWKDDPEPDAPKENYPDPSEHPYDSFKIIVPARIGYTGLSMGAVDLKENFKIRVVGNVGSSISVGRSTGTDSTFELKPSKTVKNGSHLECTFYQDKGQGTPYEDVDSANAIQVTPEEAGYDPSNDNTPSGKIIDNSYKIFGNMLDRDMFTGHFTYSAKLSK